MGFWLGTGLMIPNPAQSLEAFLKKELNTEKFCKSLEMGRLWGWGKGKNGVRTPKRDTLASLSQQGLSGEEGMAIFPTMDLPHSAHKDVSKCPTWDILLLKNHSLFI